MRGDDDREGVAAEEVKRGAGVDYGDYVKESAVRLFVSS